MLCFAFALAAFGLGWLGVPELARVLLERRKNYKVSNSGALLYPRAATTMPRPFAAPLWVERLLSGLALACMAALCLLFLQPLPCSLALFGFALVETMCICDIKARIIPWEGCFVLLALAVPFRLAVGDLSELLLSVCLALLVLLVLATCNIVSRRLHSSTAIGLGDMRLIPALCLFGGLEGSFLGIFACTLFMGCYAILALAMKWATPRSGIPLAPGLALWFVMGTLWCALV